jgi:hypothetical protein
MKNVKCDHCEKSFDVEDKHYTEDPIVYWCEECVSENVALLDKINSKKFISKYRYWKLPGNIEKIKLIPKKSALLTSKSKIDMAREAIAAQKSFPSLNTDIKCKRRYYGIDCSCGCQPSKKQLFNTNVFRYPIEMFQK